MRWRRNKRADFPRMRSAVAELVESPRLEGWLRDVPDDVLVAIAAPIEVLTFHYYLDPPKDRHLARAAKVACESADPLLPRCPRDLAAALRKLGEAVGH